MLRSWLPLLLILALVPTESAHSQGFSFISQAALEDILNRRTEDVGSLPEIDYSYFVLYNSRNNNVVARNTFFKVLGDGDLALGQERNKLIELINRKLITNTAIGDTLVIPSDFGIDFRAFSPFPLYYEGGAEFEKLFIIDKTLQAFAAYQKGDLMRWGIVNTGSEESRTPNGRFNFNWKTEYRISSLSPPGEPWEMYWVFNFVEDRGIHIHQYPMPTGGPTSHGCVRLVDADAEWIYNWGDTWTLASNGGFSGSMGRIGSPGTTVIVIGEDPPVKPEPFMYEKRYPVLRPAVLPTHPYDIAPGTPQQEYFDRLRLSSGG